MKCCFVLLKKGDKLDLFPEISIVNHSGIHGSQEAHFLELIQSNLRKIVTPSFYELENETQKLDYIKSSFPSISWNIEEKVPSNISLLFFYKYRIYSSKFIYDLISRWLIPGKRLNISLYYGIDFQFVGDPFQRYIMIQMHLDIESYKDLSVISKTLPHLSKEIEVGITSLDQGMRILEAKGLKLDDKINVVQELVVSLMNRRSKHFDRELFVEMQHFFVFSRENFKVLRAPRHMVRIICWQYLFRLSLGYNQDPALSKRMFRVKLMRTELRTSYDSKNVLGVLVGVSYVRENESFGERQIGNAIKAYIPNVDIVSGSFLSYKKRGEGIPLMYLEVVKKDGSLFNFDELHHLKTVLPEDLKDRVEQLMHPIFMPRNEEEIMRNILNLNKQLKSQDDIPQIIIQFDKQDEMHIVFVVILLRVLGSGDRSVQELCVDHAFKYDFIPDRIKIVGKVKKGYSKEANVFYIRLDKRVFLRKDHSLDLYRARQSVLTELYRVFSDVRDYNGGMIAKESEIFKNFKIHMIKTGSYNEVLLENYFYSLTPAIIRSMVSVNLLDTSFQILSDFLEDEKPTSEGYVVKFVYQNNYIFSYIAAKDPSFQNLIHDTLLGLKLSRFQLISSFLQLEDAFYLGLIYQSDRAEERKRYCDVLRKSLELWQAKEVPSLI